MPLVVMANVLIYMPNCFWVCDVKCVILNEPMVLCFAWTNVRWTRSSWVYPLGYLFIKVIMRSLKLKLKFKKWFNGIRIYLGTYI